jgi:hypothetical protein
MHPDANRQCHGTRTTHQQNLTQSTQGHGHVFPLAMVPQCPRTISLLLETWHTNLADYFTKHHPATHHKSVHPTILMAVNDPEYRKLFQNTGDSAKLEGTNNYSRNKNFQKLPKIAETEGTKNYAQNKTSNNLLKNANLEGTINTPPS